MEHLELAIPTLFGLEGLAADELRRLDLSDVRAENGRVLCAAGFSDIPRVNLNLRTGERVLLLLGSFPADDFDALFEGVRALPWEDFLPRDAAFPVKGQCLNSALNAVPACQSIVKKAVAARLGTRYGLEHLPETGALYQIQFSIMKDTASLYLDTHPEDKEALDYFHHFNSARQQALHEYAVRFGPLTLGDVQHDGPCKDSWKWATQPWPWEGDC